MANLQALNVFDEPMMVAGMHVKPEKEEKFIHDTEIKEQVVGDISKVNLSSFDNQEEMQNMKSKMAKMDFNMNSQQYNPEPDTQEIDIPMNISEDDDEEEIELTDEEFNQIIQEHEQYKTGYEKSMKTIENLQNEKNDYYQKIQKYEKDIDGYKEKIQILESERNVLSQTIEDLKVSLAEANKNAQDTVEVEKIVEKIVEVPVMQEDNEKIMSLESQLYEKEKEIEELKKEVEMGRLSAEKLKELEEKEKQQQDKPVGDLSNDINIMISKKLIEKAREAGITLTDFPAEMMSNVWDFIDKKISQ